MKEEGTSSAVADSTELENSSINVGVSLEHSSIHLCYYIVFGFVCLNLALETHRFVTILTMST